MLGEGSKTEGGKWGFRGRELGAKREGSGNIRGGKREWDTPCPSQLLSHFGLISVKQS